MFTHHLHHWYLLKAWVFTSSAMLQVNGQLIEFGKHVVYLLLWERFGKALCVGKVSLSFSPWLVAAVAIVVSPVRQHHLLAPWGLCQRGPSWFGGKPSSSLLALMGGLRPLPDDIAVVGACIPCGSHIRMVCLIWFLIVDSVSLHWEVFSVFWRWNVSYAKHQDVLVSGFYFYVLVN